MNSIEKDLKFTIELETEFVNNRPTLDFTLWVCEVEVEDDMCPWRILHSFNRKPMALMYCEVETSARSWTSRASSLSQEVVRRSLNTSERLQLAERLSVLNNFTKMLLSLG